MSKVIAVCTQKGGVGKTTTALNLGAGLAANGKRVLLVDADTAIMKANEYIKYVEDVNKGVETLATIPEILRRRYELDYHNGYTQEPGYYHNLATAILLLKCSSYPPKPEKE